MARTQPYVELASLNDENYDGDVVRGLLRISALDLVRVQRISS
jgi:hypothetical protein